MRAAERVEQSPDKPPAIRIIGIAGAKGSGKSTAAAALVRQGWQLREMSQPLRHLFTDATFRSPDPQANKVDRIALNNMGGTLRYFLGEDALIRMALASVPFMEGTRTPGIVIPGIRLQCEVDAIHEAGGEVWRIIRPGHEPDGSFYEPTDLKLAPGDSCINNWGTEEQLVAGVLEVAEWGAA